MASGVDRARDSRKEDCVKCDLNPGHMIAVSHAAPEAQADSAYRR